MTRLLLALAFSSVAFGTPFIPPMTSVVREVFGERHSQGGIEAQLTHRVVVGPNQVVDIDERILKDGSGVYFLWRMPGVQPQPITAVLEKQSYKLGTEKSIPGRSNIFWKYLLSASTDDIRDTLIAERFMRRDHFYQYKSGFNPVGDPQTWGLKENYVRHDDVFLSRLASGVSITVQGYQEGSTSRAVSFDNNLKGMTRLEWKDGDVVGVWTFDGFQKSIWDKSFLPRRGSLVGNGGVVITTEIVAVRALKDRALFDAKATWKAASRNVTLTGNAEPALKVLASYR